MYGVRRHSSYSRSQSMPNIGVVEWFAPLARNERGRARHVASMMRKAGFTHFRFDVSWAHLVWEEWKEADVSFYDFLFPLLAEHFTLLPNLTYTPPSWGIESSCASPPKELERYGWAVDQVCRRWGSYFEYLEVWNEPNSSAYWMRSLDPDLSQFALLAKIGASVIHAAGKKAVLGGPSPIDLAWFRIMESYGVLGSFDVIGIHGFPGTWDSVLRPAYPWRGWDRHLEEVRRCIDTSLQEVWITEAGASSRTDPHLPYRIYKEVMSCDAPNIFWYSAMDFAGPTMQEYERGEVSPDDFHMGLLTRGRNPKLLYSLLTQLQSARLT